MCLCKWTVTCICIFSATFWSPLFHFLLSTPTGLVTTPTSCNGLEPSSWTFHIPSGPLKSILCIMASGSFLSRESQPIPFPTNSSSSCGSWERNKNLTCFYPSQASTPTAGPPASHTRLPGLSMPHPTGPSSISFPAGSPSALNTLPCYYPV